MVKINTLEEYFKHEYGEGKIDFSLRVSINLKGNPEFYIHPDSKDGTTVDFEVMGNELKRIRQD